MVEKVKWILVNVVFIGLVVAATAFHIEGVKNVLVAFIWLLFFIVLLSPRHVIGKAITPKIVPSSVSIAPKLIILAFFIWYGWWLTAIAYLLFLIMFQSKKYAPQHSHN